MSVQLRLPRRQLVTAISELSEQITSQEQVSNLIVRESSYQVIPGYLQSYSHHIDNIIKWFLPHSKSRLIDITLPFTYLNNNLQQTRILGRYILFDRKLRGIRISSRNKCVGELPKAMSPSALLQQYYKQNRICFSRNQILIGDFYLQLTNYRIGLFFQDQLIDFPSFKKSFESYKFDIISVVSNIQKQVNRDDHLFKINHQQKEIQHRLKTLFRQNKITVLYAGIKIVPNLRTVYWEKSFIIQDTNFITQHKSLIGEKTFIVLMANIQFSLLKKWQAWRSSKEIQIIEDQNDKYLEKLQINMKLRQNQVLPSRPVVNLNNKKALGDFYGERQSILYNLWYLYRTVNKSSPFVIPFPFSNKRQKLYNQLIALSQHCNKDIEQLVKVYRYKVDNSVSKYRLQIYDNFEQMLATNPQQFPELIYIYCEDQDEMKKLRNNPQYSNRICNCQSLIPINTNQVIDIETNQTIINKKIENACLHVLKERFQNIYQILNYFWDVQLDRKEIQKCFSQILPSKVKRFFKLTPHYLFFLQSTPQEMINEIGEAEIRLKSRGMSNIKSDENDSSKNFDQFPKKLVERIQATRKYKNNLNLLLKCHRCDYRLKKGMLSNCNKCQTMLCYDCIDVLTNHSLFELNQYKCAICLKHCKCNKCQKISQVEKITKQLPVEAISSQRFLDCAKCEILNSKYDKIQIECVQCKNMKCYNCAKAEKNFQISKMSTWICRDCYQFNEEFMNKEQKANMIEIQIDQNEMDQEIIEESVSRSASPPKIVDQTNKSVQIKMKWGKQVSEDLLVRKQSQKNNKRDFNLEINYQKIKPVNQIQDRRHTQSSKNDKSDKKSKSFDRDLQFDSRFNKNRQTQYRQKQKQRQRQKSRQRNRSRLKEKKKRRSPSDSHSDRSYRRHKKHNKKSSKLWGLEKQEKEHKREKQQAKNKQKQREKGRERDKEKEKDRDQRQEEQIIKTSKSGLWQKQKDYKQTQNNKSPIKQNPKLSNLIVPSKVSGLIFQVNNKKEKPDSQQQSY